MRPSSRRGSAGSLAARPGPTAEAIFSGVLARDGSNVEALRGRGEVLAELGDARGALRDLDRLAPAGQPSVRAARGLAPPAR